MNGTRSWIPTQAVLALAASMGCLWALPGAAESQAGRQVRTETATSDVVTGLRLRRRLEEPVPGVSWKSVPLHAVLTQMSDGFGIALIPDRRIDPTATIDLHVANKPLQEVLQDIAAAVGAEIRVTGNAVYLGPKNAASLVRTLAEIRKQELLASDSQKPESRRIELQRGKTIEWQDLTTPGEILQRISAKWDMQVENGELVPHDLWAGARLPQMSAAEMFTCVLIQFDLTFAWGEDLRSIRIVPLPADQSEIAIERTYRPPGSVETAIKRWKQRAGPLATSVAGRRVTVRGTIEQHEIIERAISGQNGPSEAMPTDPPQIVPLDRRQFSLTIARVPARSIMAKLEDSGVKFEYDADALAEAGIDLSRPVGVDVRQVDSETFFRAIFAPLGLQAEFAGTTVRLRPVD